MSKGIRIRATHRQAIPVFDRLLSTLPEHPSEPSAAFQAGEAGSSWFLEFPGGSRSSVPSLADAFYGVESYVYDHLLPDEPSCLILHGAAVVDVESGTAVLLAGPSHCGKSTLSLALTAAGGFAYLSEEAVGLRLDGSVIPYPKPFRIRAGSERLVKGRPGWSLAGTTDSGIQYVVPPRELVAPQAGQVRIRCAIFPEFRDGERCSSEGMTRAGGMAWMATCSTNRPEWLAATFHRLPALWETIQAWKLRWSDPEEAALSVRRLLRHSLSQEQGRPQNPRSPRRSLA